MDNFDAWNELKKKIDTKEQQVFFPRTREVWMTAFGKNIGFEENGSGTKFSRPVLIIKKFNNHMFWVIPLSRKQKLFDFYYNFTDPTSEKVSLMLAHVKLMSIKRFTRKMYTLDQNIFDDAFEKLKALFR